MSAAGEGITRLLIRWSNGDRSALDELMPLVYQELRRLARSHLRRQRQDHTLQPTALVNEAYLRLLGQERVSLQNRAQFFGLAAKAMRSILVDHARRHNADKRGGAEYTLSLSIADRLKKKPDVDLIALDDALNDLAAIDPKHSQVIELRFFGGLTIQESATVLGVSHATVERDWTLARAWLRRELAR
jgi:RNA polymerase sigma-70 factor (ECF subfamily)